MQERLSEKLMAYGQSDYYPFHMPGHKRNSEFLSMKDAVKMDITEIDGFDNLHRPEGILKETMESAAALYGADETRMLVNGSSAGNMAAVLGCLKWKSRLLSKNPQTAGRKAKLLMAKNCHKSVYHALEMGGYEAVYVTPEIETALGLYGQVKVEAVDACLKMHGDIGAVLITSPTYEGLVSDIEALAVTAHRYGVPLIVDEAHGAHLGFDAHFPETAVRQGADIVIQSLHKTLPCWTQTALLHLNGAEAPWKTEVLKYSTYLQTSSPSYVFMAGIDACITLLNQKGSELFAAYWTRLQYFLERCSHFERVGVLCENHQDPSKLVLFLKPVGACGKWLYDLLLNKYHLQMEMASRDYVLAMTSICDTDEGFERLYQALCEIDEMAWPAFEHYDVYSGLDDQTEFMPEISISDAADREHMTVNWEDCVGRLSAEYAYVYPPGVPVLIPGLRIRSQDVRELETYMAEGFAIEGLRDLQFKQIDVVAEE